MEAHHLSCVLWKHITEFTEGLEENWELIRVLMEGSMAGKMWPKSPGLYHCPQTVTAGHTSKVVGPGLAPEWEGREEGGPAGTLQGGSGEEEASLWLGVRGAVPKAQGTGCCGAGGGRRGPEHQAPPRGLRGRPGEGGEAAPALGQRCKFRC